MNTDELIDRLSQGLKPVSADAAMRRLAVAFGAGAVLASIGLLALIGTRPDLAEAVRTGPFWMKAAYTAGLAAAGFFVVERVSRPGGAGGKAWLLVAAVTSLALLMGAIELLSAEPADRAQIWFGHSWNFCMPRIVGLSAPVFLAAIWAMRSLAPTQLRLAGFAAGIAAGAVGATVYGVSCVESTAAFMATWYTLGVLAVGVIGTLAGPRLLRW
jgi:hypothetical protein